MSNEELEVVLDAVVDEEAFVAFLGALAENREEENEIEKVTPSSQWGRGAMGWENGSIEAFLGAATAWATSTKNGTPGGYVVPDNPWKRCAEIILMGKIYE